MRSFLKTGKTDGDLSRYFPNILPITRQLQIAGKLPRKAYARVTYPDKKNSWNLYQILLQVLTVIIVLRRYVCH